MGYTVPPAFTAGAVLLGSQLTILGDDIKDLDSRTRPIFAQVPTSQTTTSTSYTDLATVGPTVTITTGTIAIVCLIAQIQHSTGGPALVGFAVSGATTAAAADTQAIYYSASAANEYAQFSGLFLVSGLTAGSNVFTAKYKVSSGTGTFLNRQLFVWPGNNLS